MAMVVDVVVVTVSSVMVEFSVPVSVMKTVLVSVTVFVVCSSMVLVSVAVSVMVMVLKTVMLAEGWMSW